jgi:hypothetical protein
MGMTREAGADDGMVDEVGIDEDGFVLLALVVTLLDEPSSPAPDVAT